MAYDQLMRTYLGVGLLADRPATPNVAPGVGAFYYATDTVPPALTCWDGATWHTLAGGSTALADDSDVAIAAPTDGEVLTYAAADGKWENKAAPGGASGALTKLDEVIVGAGGQANIQFSNIDQGYRHLQLIATLRSDAAGTDNVMGQMRLNGDNGLNYYDVSLIGAGSATYNGQDYGVARANIGNMGGATSTPNLSSPLLVLFPEYSGTTFSKNWLAHNMWGRALASSSLQTQMWCGVWGSTAAITSILLSPASGNFVQDSVASLYGLS